VTCPSLSFFRGASLDSPQNSSLPHYRYVILGGGTTALAAVEAILTKDRTLPGMTKNAHADSEGGGGGILVVCRSMDKSYSFSPDASNASKATKAGSGVGASSSSPSSPSSPLKKSSSSSSSSSTNIHQSIANHTQLASSPLPPDLSQSYNEWRRHITSRLDPRFRPGSPGRQKITVKLGVRDRDIVIDKGCRYVNFGPDQGLTVATSTATATPATQGVGNSISHNAVTYDKLLIATAGRPRALYVLGDPSTSSSTKGGAGFLHGSSIPPNLPGGNLRARDTGRGRGVVGTGDRVNALMGLEDFRRLDSVVDDVSRGWKVKREGEYEDEDTALSLSSGLGLSPTATNIATTATATHEPSPPEPKRIVIVGGGFLGTEIALSLASRSRKNRERRPDLPLVEIIQLYAERDPLVSYLPSYLARDVRERMERRGVRCRGEVLVTDLREEEEAGDDYDDDYDEDDHDHHDHDLPDLRRDGENGKFVAMSLVGQSRSSLSADYVILASSTITPSVASAANSGLEINPDDSGVVTDDSFEVGNGVYAAGVVASYYDPSLGRRRVNRYDHSINSGLTAGFNMVSSYHDGKQIPYDHQPAVRSFLKDINVNCDIVGDCNSDLDTVGVWVRGRLQPRRSAMPGTSAGNVGDSSDSGGDSTDSTDSSDSGGSFLSDVSKESQYKRGAIYYLKDNRIVGITLWNAGDLLERARDVLKYSPSTDASSHDHITAPTPASIASRRGGSSSTGTSRGKALMRKMPLAPDEWLFVKETKGREDLRGMVTEDEREFLVYPKK